MVLLGTFINSLFFREKHGIAKSIDADEQTRNQIENKKEEIKRNFEIEIAKDVAGFWSEKDVDKEAIRGKVLPFDVSFLIRNLDFEHTCFIWIEMA